MTLEDRIEEYLKSLHAELWPAEAFYLSQPQGRQPAIEWLAEIIRKVEH